MENGENLFSSTGEEWRTEKTSCAKVLPQSFCFSPGRFIHQSKFLQFIRVKHTKVIQACEQSIYSYHKLTHR